MPSPSRRHSPDHRRSRSPDRRDRRRSRSPRRRSPPPRHSRRSPSPRRNERRRPPSSLSQGRKIEWGREEDRQKLEQQKREPLNEEDIQKPNFGLSGALAAETNTTAQGVELKYNEPPEAAKPNEKWRLYVFKGDKQIDVLHVHRQSSYLIGRDRLVVDIPSDHPSCSKQHAVLQYRLVTDQDPKTGKTQQVVKPFVIDLESTNGTYLNGEQIPATRFVELRMKDMLRFGDSTREYILLHS
ncbi:SMAD/FHA domain-containing protein [Syncephalastrum racemosum]|uniref:SMAD/FHA domain-containing protein n=1 Tax=Syncephalastrum racemosum TaxID=13706 RepID=A0A1X2HNY0_SYNRA|nr:SMAD/FHA domain-containing protein [Syncephalastrum racemosum]